MTNGALEHILFVSEFFNNVRSNGVPMFSKAEYWLHCDSTFLVERQPSDTAWDLNGKDIYDSNNNSVRIEDIPVYKAELQRGNNKPWWPGNLTALNGYYFDERGANFCHANNTNLGLTARIQRVIRNANGSVKIPQDDRVASVILCPLAFSRTTAPDNYRDASNSITGPGKDLNDVVPKSATLLHEVFHAIHGVDMLSGADEKCEFSNSLLVAGLPPIVPCASPDKLQMTWCNVFD